MTRLIRNYIYLDADRLRSIYAQINEGLLESIQSSDFDAESKREGSFLGSLETELLFGGNQRTTKVLHDFLCTAVEAQLDEKISNWDNIAEPEIDKIGIGDFVKVSGLVELDEPLRLMALINEYNEFLQLINLASTAREHERKIFDLEDKLRKAKKVDKIKIQNQIDELMPKQMSRSLSNRISFLTQDLFEKYLRLLNSNVFEIKLIYSNDIVFRAIVDENHLREESRLLYAKYSSRPQSPWTLFGQITSINSADMYQKDVENEPDVMNTQDYSSESGQDILPDVRDSIRAMYDALHAIEKITMTSKTRKTAIVTPLAIYHEH